MVGNSVPTADDDHYEPEDKHHAKASAEAIWHGPICLCLSVCVRVMTDNASKCRAFCFHSLPKCCQLSSLERDAAVVLCWQQQQQHCNCH